MSSEEKKEKKHIGQKILDFFEVDLTGVTFLVIFVSFLTSIISRYVLRAPVPWTYETSILGYMWTMYFGVGRALRNDEHVVFSLVYDKMNPKGKAVCRIIYNALLCFLLVIIFWPGLQTLSASSMVTGVLKIPYKVAFAPYFFMLAECIVTSFMDCIRAGKELKALGSGKGAEA
ncbi:MAG: TRAP transporter small permease [Bilifractor sp.]|jgi:TRAP-type C4-dicarboxylate transport system permease small subunit